MNNFKNDNNQNYALTMKTTQQIYILDEDLPIFICSHAITSISDANTILKIFLLLMCMHLMIVTVVTRRIRKFLYFRIIVCVTATMEHAIYAMHFIGLICLLVVLMQSEIVYPKNRFCFVLFFIFYFYAFLYIQHKYNFRLGLCK